MRGLNVLVVFTGAAALFGMLSSGCFLVPECVQCNEANTGGGTTGTAGTGGTGATGGTGGTSGMGGIGGTGGSTGSTTSMPPLMCDPNVDSPVVDEECGIFVSSTMGNDMTGKGSKDEPYATIGKALATAASGARVYLCAEDFNETVSMSQDVTIHGGLDCMAPIWPWVGDMKKTRIAPLGGGVPLTVDSQVALTVEDVAFESTAGDADGSSSIAIIADSAAELTLTRCDVKADDAKDGAAGAEPPDALPKGMNGNDGAAACTNSTVVGGGEVKNKCDPVDNNDKSVGGAGGNGSESQGGDGSKGLWGNNMGADNGGLGEGQNVCTAGGMGADGTAGANGAGGVALGTISTTGYHGADGADGGKGLPGQGGGGGGGAKGGSNGGCALANFAGGASGGSGGAGGCGGLGGDGGKAGGSSIGILSLGAILKFEKVTVTTGKGGDGGDGKPGQSGASGGDGGLGGAKVGSLEPGCKGGKGGKGGDGGAGGGGRGGHSIGIAYTGNLPPSAGVTIVSGTAGMGGNGGAMGGTNNGDGGTQADMQKFD